MAYRQPICAAYHLPSAPLFPFPERRVVPARFPVLSNRW
jgi:hypothetical protein